MKKISEKQKRKPLKKNIPKVAHIRETNVEYIPSVKENKIGSGILFTGDCTNILNHQPHQLYDLSFLDPPFNQNKEYSEHEDNMPEEEFWNWMSMVSNAIFKYSSQGSAIYFMQREKNTEHVLRCLRETGWTFQNLIIWKKKTSAVPGMARFGKHYQIIAFATKGEKPRIFNRLRIDPPLPIGYKYGRENGMFTTDVWDDIRELTSGYFAGDEPLRDKDGQRLHKQQAPVELLLRIILSSTNPGDVVFDPFAGTGTTFIVGNQLKRRSVIIELDPKNVNAIQKRYAQHRSTDDVHQYYSLYKYTPRIQEIWGSDEGAFVDSLNQPGQQLRLIKL
ncbi:MAG: DNA-methyltransferase [Bacteroidota bacterium]